MGLSGQLHTFATLPPWKMAPATNEQEHVEAPEPAQMFWSRCKYLGPTGNERAVPQVPVHYPGSHYLHVLLQNYKLYSKYGKYTGITRNKQAVQVLEL